MAGRTRAQAVRRFAAAILALLCAWGTAQAQYPAKPVRVVVPFPPGGPVDAEVNKALATDLRQRLLDQGYELSPGTPEEFAKFQREDIARSAKIVAEANIRAE